MWNCGHVCTADGNKIGTDIKEIWNFLWSRGPEIGPFLSVFEQGNLKKRPNILDMKGANKNLIKYL